MNALPGGLARTLHAMKVDVLAEIPNLVAFVDRFFTKVSPEPNTGCHIWTAALNTCGYAVVAINNNGRVAYAHRVALEIAGRQIPAGMTVDHTCGVRCCVNPAHLDIVTHAENCRRRDAVRPRSRQAANQSTPVNEQPISIASEVGP